MDDRGDSRFRSWESTPTTTARSSMNRSLPTAMRKALSSRVRNHIARTIKPGSSNNGAVVWRFVGYARFSGSVAGQTLSHLDRDLRLFVNDFQPSFKPQGKQRDDAKVKKTDSSPTTPCDRLLTHPGVEDDVKDALRRERAALDPAQLLHRIRQSQSALASLASPGQVTDEQECDLDRFLAQLPRLWQQGEVRPTHRRAPAKAHDYRTRKDPFEGEWATELGWLEQEPDATANELFLRLHQEHPGKFPDGLLRTLQQRVRQWRHIMAKNLVYNESTN